MTRIRETSLVKEELDALEEGARIYKLIGPVLVPRDLPESKENVEARLEYLTNEETTIAENVKKIQAEMNTIRAKLQGST